MDNPPVKLLDRARQCIRLGGYSIRTEKSYVSWIRRYILFHGKRHPRKMGKLANIFGPPPGLRAGDLRGIKTIDIPF